MRTAIRVENLSKEYRLNHGSAGGYATLRESLSGVAAAAWRFLKALPQRKPSAAHPAAARPGSFWALRDLDFDVRPGEVLGIIGRNGAGKSTLLKVLSRITEPSAGRVTLRGRVGSLLEVGTGFHPELSGRENIFLNGAILGMTRREIERKLDEMVAFAEIGEFLDMPVKRYSSGMYVRLAYSVAAHMEPEILLIDEVLSVGDLRFQRKCMDHARRLRESNAAVLFVSHNMFAVKALCNRVLFLSHGRPEFLGDPQEAIHRYEQESQLDVPAWARNIVGSDPAQFPIRIVLMETFNEAGVASTFFEHGERVRVRLHYEADQTIAAPNFVIGFVRSDNVACCNYSTALDNVHIPPVQGKGTVEVLTPPLKLVAESYAVHVGVWDPPFHKLYCSQVGSTVHVRHPLLSSHYGVFHEHGQWSMGGSTN
jgi:lipopolysaccharide transport system ATP-binding protein